MVYRKQNRTWNRGRRGGSNSAIPAGHAKNDSLEDPHIATARLLMRDVQVCVDQGLRSVQRMQQLVQRSRSKIVYCWRHVLSKPRDC